MSKYKVTLETHSVADTQCFGERLGHWVKQNGNPLCMALVYMFLHVKGYVFHL